MCRCATANCGAACVSCLRFVVAVCPTGEMACDPADYPQLDTRICSSGGQCIPGLTLSSTPPDTAPPSPQAG